MRPPSTGTVQNTSTTVPVDPPSPWLDAAPAGPGHWGPPWQALAGVLGRPGVVASPAVSCGAVASPAVSCGAPASPPATWGCSAAPSAGPSWPWPAATWASGAACWASPSTASAVATPNPYPSRDVHRYGRARQRL